MLKKYFYYFLLFLLPSFLSAQYAEVGGSLGVANYFGDLTPPQSVFKEFNMALSLQGRYNFSRRFAVRGQLGAARISGDDRHSDFSSGRLQRNLSFRSRIWEAALLGEINILPYDPSARKKPIVPYAFAGIAFFHFRPQAQYSFEWVDLQPLGTEGQGLAAYPERQPYSLWQFSIPFGGGVKLSLGDSWSFSVEIGLRKTFTDYLDDVSTTYPDSDLLRAQRGDLAVQLSNRSIDEAGNTMNLDGTKRGSPEGKDWYTFSGISFSKIFAPTGPLFYGKDKRKQWRQRKKNSGMNRDF